MSPFPPGMRQIWGFGELAGCGEELGQTLQTLPVGRLFTSPAATDGAQSQTALHQFFRHPGTGDALSLGSKATARAWPHVVLRSHCPILSPPDGFTRRWTTAPVWQGSELTGCYHCLLCTTRRPTTGQGVALSVILGALPCSVSWEKAGGCLSHSQPHPSPWVSLPSFMTCQAYLERPPQQNGPVHVFIKLKWSPRSCV